MNFLLKITLSSLLLVLLAACASPPAPTPVPLKRVLQDQESARLLSSAIQRAERLPEATSSADATAAPAVMTGKSLSINFVGDAKDLLRRVAAARGLSYEVQGSPPYLPLFVVVNVKNASLEAFMSDVGAQFGQRATLALSNGAIEVRYSGR